MRHRPYTPATTEEEAWQQFAEIIAVGLVEAWREGRFQTEEQGRDLGPSENTTLSEAA